MKYKCNNCDDITDFLTLGDTTIGCANCGVRAGFEELEDDTNLESSEVENE